MRTYKMKKTTSRALAIFFATLFLFLLATGCDVFRPSRAVPVENQSAVFIAPTPLPIPLEVEVVSTANPGDPSPNINCVNDLLFLDDLTIPDGTQLTGGTPLEKEWQVKNSGSCNWNENYTVRLISGPDMGAAAIQALVPARNGSEAVIRIQFIAPTEPGRYTASWQAFDADQKPFGQWFSIEIVVTTP